MTEGEPIVRYEVQGPVALITLNRPERLNALGRDLVDELDAALDQADANGAVRAVVLTGTGRAFSAGADLKSHSLPRGRPRALWEHFQATERRQSRLLRGSKITIAAVHGYCLGRGLELALHCDLVLADPDARFGQPEVREGSFLASVVPWLIGPQRAKLFMLSGNHFDARQAERWGLVTYVVEDGPVLDEALRLAQRLSNVPLPATRAIKQFVNTVYDEFMGQRVLNDVLGPALTALSRNMSPEEKEIAHLIEIREQQGLKAFLEARDAPYRF